MEPFTTLTGVAAPLPIANVNTDMIIRVEALMYVPKGELRPHCLAMLRQLPDGTEDPDFVLNKPAYRNSRILVAGPNFGCGSSRENAVWAMQDFGFRCIIAPSFGDIFRNNMFQNGLLPIVLPQDVVDHLAAEAAKAEAGNGGDFTVDLVGCTITAPSGEVVRFTIDPARRETLLRGLDEVGQTMLRDAEIVSYEDRDRARRPWIYNIA